MAPTRRERKCRCGVFIKLASFQKQKNRGVDEPVCSTCASKARYAFYEERRRSVPAIYPVGDF